MTKRVRRCPYTHKFEIEETLAIKPKSYGEVLRFVKLTQNAAAPSKGSADAAGFDLRSAYDYEVQPSGKVLALTDLQIAVPEGCYGRVAPRSGPAHKNFIDVGHADIARGYRGNVGVILFNSGQEVFRISKGDRIAQLICERIAYPSLEECTSLDETVRGQGAFGSTGTN